MTIDIYPGDCLKILPTLPRASVDAVCTDPPAGISFMRKSWDSNKGGRDAWIDWLSQVMRETLRMMKPGAFGLIWALPRTSHWTATALEEAGWQIRDRISHLFGTGFPKSKSCLKPAVEDWWLVKAPGKLQPLQIDACRIPGSKPDTTRGAGGQNGRYGKLSAQGRILDDGKGRYPANITHDGSDEVMEAFAAFGKTRPGHRPRSVAHPPGCNGTMGKFRSIADTGEPENNGYDDSGTAARFFYCAKASRSEREAGLEDLPKVEAGIGDERPSGQSMQRLDGRSARRVRNTHPCVKPLALIQWLIRLITPPGGTVLDHFAGSGTLGIAAMREGYNAILIEREPEYVKIMRQRINHEKSIIQ